MEEIEVVQVIVIARAKGESWMGEAMYDWAPAAVDWLALHRQIMEEAFATADCHLDRNKRWMIDIHLQRIRLKGPRAMKVRHILNGIGNGDAPPFIWMPVASVTYYPKEYPGNGN